MEVVYFSFDCTFHEGEDGSCETTDTTYSKTTTATPTIRPSQLPTRPTSNTPTPSTQTSLSPTRPVSHPTSAPSTTSFTQTATEPKPSSGKTSTTPNPTSMKSTTSYPPPDKTSVVTSEKPSVVTSEKPSVVTSEKPSVVTSEKPSVVTSQKPSGVTSEKPSVVTSEKPSVVTSEKPSVVTSQKPSVVTSQKPSVVTSQKPSVVTSQKPSVSTSSVPNPLPVTTSATLHPTVKSTTSNPPTEKPSTVTLTYPITTYVSITTPSNNSRLPDLPVPHKRASPGPPGGSDDGKSIYIPISVAGFVLVLLFVGIGVKRRHRNRKRILEDRQPLNIEDSCDLDFEHPPFQFDVQPHIVQPLSVHYDPRFVVHDDSDEEDNEAEHPNLQWNELILNDIHDLETSPTEEFDEVVCDASKVRQKHRKHDGHNSGVV